MRRAANSATAQNGTLTKNIQRQFRLSTIAPPSSGPSTGASIAGTETMLITRPIRSGPASRTSMVCPTGSSIPPPRPWSTRNAISEGTDQANPHSRDPLMNSPSETSHIRRAPNRRTDHAVIGIAMDRARV
ncbi:hypothetical protein LUX39_34000 [Actinomadura madurae]|nr:hypothetical protein [Actinomadura madurae]MCQ0018189.1 hypothetical protein [Actinomadura madurae]